MVFEEILSDEEMLGFFANEMELKTSTITQIQLEGISTPKDLADFHESDMKQLADNLRRPPGRIEEEGRKAGTVVTVPGFVFGAKTQQRMIAAAKLIRYYKMIGRPLTIDCLIWDPVIANFKEQWEALEKREKEDDPDPPKVSRSLPIIRWTESFQDHLH